MKIWASQGPVRRGRTGFQRLISEVSLDHVGMIFGVEMSRLARSNKDWHQLLELCALFHTLIADLDGMYDPAQYNDRLLLGLKGTMSEAELHILKQRMHQGRLSKAQQGELQFALPVGYVWSPTGEIQFDPDEQVQQVVQLIFRKFEDLGTLGGCYAIWPSTRSNWACVCARALAKENWSGAAPIGRRYR